MSLLNNIQQSIPEMAHVKEISSIIKAAEVLKCLLAGENKLSRIARKLNYNKSTIHRILVTLKKVGFATQDPITKSFYLGPILHSISDNFSHAHEGLNKIALNHMESLRDATEETVNLQIPMGEKRVIITLSLMIREYMYFAKIGDTFPVHTGAAGRVLLSMLTDDDLILLLNKLMLLPTSTGQIDKQVTLLKEIKKVRIQGHAIEFYKSPMDVGAYSVPVKNYISPLALTIVGIKDRLRANQDDLLKELKKTSKDISADLAKVYV